MLCSKWDSIRTHYAEIACILKIHRGNVAPAMDTRNSLSHVFREHSNECAHLTVLLDNVYEYAQN